MLTPPAWASSTFYLPFVEHDSNHETEVAIANTTATAAQVTIMAYDATGSQVGQTQRDLAGRGQVAGPLSDFFAVPATFTGWLRIDGTAELSVLGALFQTDTGQSTAVAVSRVPDVIQFLPHVLIGNGWTTSVAVANTSPQAGYATLVLYDPGGNLLGTFKVLLPALGQAVLDLGPTFKVAILAGGHLEVVTAQPAVSSGTFTSVDAAAFVGAQRLGAAGGDGKWTQWLPYTRNDRSHWTDVAYSNLTGVPSLVTVDLIASDGSLVASKAEVIAAESQSVLALSDLATGWRGAGYVRLSADAAIAALTLSGAGRQAAGPRTGAIDRPMIERRPPAQPEQFVSTLTATNGQSQNASELYLPHVAEGGGHSSRITLINVTPASATITLQAYDQSGHSLTTGSLTLAPNQQMNSALASLLSLNNQSGGSLQITSSVPIVAMDQFTDARGMFCVEAQPPTDISERTIPAIVVANQTVGPAGAEISTEFPGGQNNYLSRLHLSIPPGALTSATEIQVLVTAPVLAQSNNNISLQQYPIRLLPTGLQFQIPALLTIPLSPDVVSTVQQRHALVASTYDELTNTFQGVPIVSYDDANNTVTIEIQHFSTKQVEATL
ncbi:MAG: hypothetical protein ABSD20_20145, partial [Terriglobales bacterium]